MTQPDTLSPAATSVLAHRKTSAPVPVDLRVQPPAAAVDPYAGLPGETERAQLVARGWSFEPTPQGCVLRKFAPGYPAKAHVVSARATDAAHFATYGEVLLHGQSCSRTGTSVVPRERLFERLSYLLDATEALNVFDDAAPF
jgi:hypothetical protein